MSRLPVQVFGSVAVNDWRRFVIVYGTDKRWTEHLTFLLPGAVEQQTSRAHHVQTSHSVFVASSDLPHLARKHYTSLNNRILFLQCIQINLSHDCCECEHLTVEHQVARWTESNRSINTYADKSMNVALTNPQNVWPFFSYILELSL